MLKDILTTGEIGKYCRVTYRTVLRWIEDGRLDSFVTPGGHHRVRKQDFMIFLKKHNMPLPGDVMLTLLPKKILVVDDDPDTLMLFSTIIRKDLKCEVAVARDGFDAASKLLEWSPELVVLDIMMPGMDGYEVAQRIKNNSKLAHIKILAVSTIVTDEIKSKIIGYGADLCIEKTFDPKQLCEAISGLLDQS